jgi:hypothetical protein
LSGPDTLTPLIRACISGYDLRHSLRQYHRQYGVTE